MYKTKRLFSCLALLGLLTTSQAQQTGGSTLVMPSEFLLIQEGYSSEINGKQIPEWQKAYDFNYEIQGAGSKIETALENRGFEVKSFSNVLRAQDGFELEASLSTINGQEVYRTSYDKYVQAAKPDVLVSFNWKLTGSGPNQYFEMTLQIIDAYTLEIVGSIVKKVQPGSFNWDLNTFIQAAVDQSVDELAAIVKEEILELERDGVQVTYTFKIDQGLSFHDYIDELDMELYEFIADWMLNNAVRGRTGTNDIGDTQCMWSPHVPLRNEAGLPLNADQWIRSLKKELRSYGYSARYNSAKNRSNASINISKLD